MKSKKPHRTTFCGKPCVRNTRALPQRGQDWNPKGGRGKVDVPSIRNYLLGFRGISEVDILVQITQISAVARKIGIPVSVYRSGRGEGWGEEGRGEGAGYRAGVRGQSAGVV